MGREGSVESLYRFVRAGRSRRSLTCFVSDAFVQSPVSFGGRRSAGVRVSAASGTATTKYEGPPKLLDDIIRQVNAVSSSVCFSQNGRGLGCVKGAPAVVCWCV